MIELWNELQTAQRRLRIAMDPDEEPEAGTAIYKPDGHYTYGKAACVQVRLVAMPAASVTDAIARRMVAEYDAVLCGDPTATRTDGMRAALEAALAAQGNPNG